MGMGWKVGGVHLQIQVVEGAKPLRLLGGSGGGGGGGGGGEWGV